MRTEDEIRRVAWALMSEAETRENAIPVRATMAYRAAQLFWALNDAHSISLQMKMELLAGELEDRLKTI